MKVIKADYSIARDPTTHKKLITSPAGTFGAIKSTTASNSHMDNYPDLTFEEAQQEIDKLMEVGFHIRAMDNLVIVDTDDKKHYDEVSDILRQLHVTTFTISTDKGFGHFYFRNTDTMRNSPLVKTSIGIVRLGGLDIIQKQGWTFGWGDNNPTKTLESSSASISDAIEIPPEIVDYLEGLKVEQDEAIPYSDASSYTTYNIGKQLKQALEDLDIYRDNVNYDPRVAWDKFFVDIAPYFTPNKYKHQMDPKLYPDSLVQDGTGYIQATVSKMLRDRSISHTQGMSLLKFMCCECWSEPLTMTQLAEKTTNYTSQSVDGISYAYDPNLLVHPAISLNNGPMGRLYRTAKGEWLVETSEGMEIFPSLPQLNDTVMSKGCSSQGLPKQLTNKTKEKFIGEVETIKIVNNIQLDYGVQETETGFLVFNKFRRTILHDIILGNEPEPSATVEDFPSIMYLLHNITSDHKAYPSHHGNENEQEDMIEKLHYFHKWKGTEIRYSPLIFQLNGIGGAGKGLYSNLMGKLFGHRFKLSIDKSNWQFNGGIENCMYADQSEIPVNHENTERLKDRSGDELITMERKGIDAVDVPNLATILVSTNSDKTFEIGRRFVVFNCFGAKVFPYASLNKRLFLELRRYAAFLRDLPVKSAYRELHITSKLWNADLLDATLETQTSVYGGDKPTQFGKLLEHTRDLSGEELMEKLNDILGEGFFRYYVKKHSVMRIPLHKAGFTDNKGRENTHTISNIDLKQAGYVSKPQVDANNRHLYSTSPTYRYIDLTMDQRDYIMKNVEKLDISMTEKEVDNKKVHISTDKTPEM